eukprot:COSAG02_NODE_6149_length_3767_cov_1.609051_4_plen_540_part_00
MFSASPVESWRARIHWQDPDYFVRSAAAPQMLSDVAVGAVNWNWDPAKSLCEAHHDVSAACNESCAACHGDAAYQRPWRNVTLVRFLHALQEGRKAIYYSPIEREFAAFAHDIDFGFALDALERQELTDLREWQPSVAGSASATASEPPLTYVWLGANGVTTQCHYDLSHNVHAVLGGHKTFILSDVKSAAHLLLYPRSHPGSTKSQLNLQLENQTKTTAARAPIVEGDRLAGTEFAGLQSARRIPGTKVELAAGDVLYLPPLMFHHVMSNDPRSDIETEEIGAGTDRSDSKSNWLSVSANLWTYSAEYAVWEALLSLPLPDLFGSDGEEEGVVTGPSATTLHKSLHIRAVQNGACEERENDTGTCGLTDVEKRLLQSVKARGLLSWSLLVVEVSNVTGLADNRIAAHHWVKTVLGDGRYKTSRSEYGIGGRDCFIPKEDQVLSSHQLDQELQRLTTLHNLQEYSERVLHVLNEFATDHDDYCHDLLSQNGQQSAKNCDERRGQKQRTPSLQLSTGARSLLVANYLDEVRQTHWWIIQL